MMILIAGVIVFEAAVIFGVGYWIGNVYPKTQLPIGDDECQMD